MEVIPKMQLLEDQRALFSSEPTGTDTISAKDCTFSRSYRSKDEALPTTKALAVPVTVVDLFQLFSGTHKR